MLSARDSVMFVEALLNPKGPNEALLAAADRYREQFGSVSSDEHGFRQFENNPYRLFLSMSDAERTASRAVASHVSPADSE